MSDGATHERFFDHDGRSWIARLAGKGACGTGSYGLALVEAVHFHDAAEPDRPLFEALIARGRFESLHDEEFGALLARSTRIVPGEPVAAPAPRQHDHAADRS